MPAQSTSSRRQLDMSTRIRALGCAKAADDFDYSIMLRLEQWRGSSLQSAKPIAKQLACWDFHGRAQGIQGSGIESPDECLRIEAERDCQNAIELGKVFGSILDKAFGAKR